jgi:hypothetical protein
MSTKRSNKTGKGDKEGSCHSQQTKKTTCSTCTEDIKSDYDVQCSICEDVFCMVCSDFGYQEIDMLKDLTMSHPDIIWVCTQCSDRVKDLKNNFTISKTMNKDIESIFTQAVKGLEKSIKNIDQAVNVEMTKTLATTETNMSKTFAEVLKNEHTKQAEHSKGTMKNIMQEQMKEWSDSNKNPNEGMVNAVKSVIQEGRVDQLKDSWDKEERDKNIIIFKAEESRNTEPEGRKKEDERIVNGTLDALGLEDIETKAIFRLGRYDINKHENGKSRPLKVLFHTKENRDQIMRNVFKLRNAPAKLQSLSIAHDLTLTERDELKKKLRKQKKNPRTQTHSIGKLGVPHGPFV